jgi:organic radical activating enzyme
MQPNQQRPEPISTSDTLLVHSVWPTIQGEGPYAGSPAVFVRLAGCNIQCPACDTDYTSVRMPYTAYNLSGLVYATRRSGVVVITGGEPLRQDIGPFCQHLLDLGFTVQVETNGMLYRDNVPYDKITVVCSPKTPFLATALLPHIKAYKYVVQKGFISDIDGLPTSALGRHTAVARPSCWSPLVPIYIQPLDEQDPILNQENLEEAIRVCSKYDYRLCLQIHKIIGLD